MPVFKIHATRKVSIVEHATFDLEAENHEHAIDAAGRILEEGDGSGLAWNEEDVSESDVSMPKIVSAELSDTAEIDGYVIKHAKSA